MEEQCSKGSCLITSQNDTAPKLILEPKQVRERLITSQNDTAPKQHGGHVVEPVGLITSQNDTAPKRHLTPLVTRQRLITSQNDTAPKQVWVAIPSLDV